MPIRPTASDPTTAFRIPGPSADPADSYWRKLEADAVGYAARTIRVEEPALAGALSEDNAAHLRRSFAHLRAILPNTRLVLSAGNAAFSRESMPVAVRLPVDAMLLDTSARPRLLVEALALAPAGLELLVSEAPG